MKIELKNVKHCKWMSEETECYSASVYINGERAFSASNDGHGGCDSYRPFDTKGKELLKQAEEYAESLPPVESQYFPDGLPYDLELLIGELLDNHLEEKEYMNKSKNNTLFKLPDDNEYTYHHIKATGKDATDYIKSKYPNAIIFNRKSKKFE